MTILLLRPEQETLDHVLRDARRGQSRTLVVRGEAGIGKTTLLDHLAERASSARVLRTVGVESESKLAYSALQQLCAPLMGGLDTLEAPQRAAVSTAFGLSAGQPPERLLVGLAVLRLLAEAASEQPLVCIVDDAHWIDAASAVILGFVARRLSTESVALVFAARSPGGDGHLAGLPELRVRGLPDADARALLDSVLTGPVDPRVRDRIVAEARGNLGALIELPQVLSPAELVFGFSGRGSRPLMSRVEEGFQRRIAALPAETRTVLLAAAVEPVGDAIVLWRVLERLGVGPAAVEPAVADRLIQFGARVRFPHPLVRSAAWRCGTAAELRAVHDALAMVTDQAQDPDRRAWHRAHAALSPDDEIAAALEGSVGRALARGGWPAAAALLERAAELTSDLNRRGRLLVVAAGARAGAGAGSYAMVPDLLGAAEMSPLDPLRQAHVERLRAQVAFMLHHNERAAGPPLLAAARRLGKLDPIAARDTFLLAISAAMCAGRFGGDHPRVVAEAARDVVPAGGDFPDLLLAGLISWVLDGRVAAVPRLRGALDAMGSADVGHIWLAAAVAYDVFRLDVAYRMSEAAVRSALEFGALSLLPDALAVWANSLIDGGRLADAANLMKKIDTVTRPSGATVDQLSRLVLAAYSGPEQSALDLIKAKLRDAADREDGRLHAQAHFGLAVLHNGLGNYPAAKAAAQEVIAYPELALGNWALRELVEAAARAGEPGVAADARDQLAERTAATITPSALGIQALADALTGRPEQAEERYREAIERLSVTETVTQGYRARLLFGEWLRRANRRAEARVELRAAYEAFATMGAHVFAERARRELAATGETVRGRTTGARQDLTPQEAAITRLVISGRTNQDIAAELFLSPRTVEWHLRKIFTKVGITSRRELTEALLSA
ncbi:AAA family ATPase [Actinoplanes sp. NPDC000266]